MAIYAGFWGPELILLSNTGTPAKGVSAEVRKKSNMVLATLYTDETKMLTVVNPTKTDSFGNLQFFAEPDDYLVTVDGSGYAFMAVVRPDLSEPGGGSGVTDHGQLTGLGDDDHTQYHNNARGDARYYTQGAVDTALAGKANTSHTHSAAQVTDLNTAVDARIQNVIGTAPAALDTLGEIADALNDDASFAATVTTALASKQPLDADLTAIAALAPADGSVLARIAGVWSSETTAQLKTSMEITAADVGLGNVNNTSDLAKPISTSTQAALDLKAPRIQIVDPITKYGIVAAPGRFGEFQNAGGFTNQWAISRCFVPANSGPLTRMVIPTRSASTGYVSNGKPNQLGWWNDAGVFQSATPDDSTMWDSVDWYVATLSSPVPNNVADMYVYGGFQINGQTGVSQFVQTGASDTGNIPFSHAPGSTKRFGAYTGSVATFTDLNPNTFGTLTSFIVFLGFME